MPVSTSIEVFGSASTLPTNSADLSQPLVISLVSGWRYHITGNATDAFHVHETRCPARYTLRVGKIRSCGGVTDAGSSTVATSTPLTSAASVSPVSLT